MAVVCGKRESVIGSNNCVLCVKNSFIHVPSREEEEDRIRGAKYRSSSAPPVMSLSNMGFSEDQLSPPAVEKSDELPPARPAPTLERDDEMVPPPIVTTNRARTRPGTPPLEPLSSGRNSTTNASSAPSNSENIFYTVFISPACERSHIDLAPTTTTLMVRNIPTRFTSVSFLRILDECGFRNCFDFFYLPMDFRTGKNMGYCFLNFTTPEFARGFASLFHGRRLRMTTSTKVIEISPSRRQGLIENVALFKASDLLGSLSLPHFKPLVLVGGALRPLSERTFAAVYGEDSSQ
jgi:hypothetical protein